MDGKILRLRMGLLAALLAFAGAIHAAEPGDSSVGRFCNLVARGVYLLAWPTATFQRWEYRDMTTQGDHTDLTIRLFGTRHADGGSLWTDVTLDVENGRVINVFWGEHSPSLLAPGATTGALLKAWLKRQQPS